MLDSLADRIGSHPRRVLLAVLAFVAVAGFVGGPIAGELEDSGGFNTEDSGSALAIDRIEEATGEQAAPGVVLLVESPAGPESPATSAQLRDLGDSLAGIPGIGAVASPATDPSPALISEDGSTTLVTGRLDADAGEDLVTEAVVEAFGEEEGVTLGGELVADTQIGETVVEDLGRAELIAFPILLILSLLFFRGRAALLPLLVGITTVFATFLALTAINQAYGLSIFALNLVIGLGLGLAIDYTLFLVSRYREELAKGGEVPGAIRTTMATAGRTVAFSSLTVSAALITLTVFPLGFLKSMGLAGAIVAAMAALAALVISPALFAIWGDKLSVRRRSSKSEEQGTWYRLSHLVMSRPALVAAVTGVVMLAAAIPSLRVIWTPVDASVIPTDLSSRVVADALVADFPDQDATPAVLVFDAPDSAGGDLATYADGITGRPGVRSVGEPQMLDASTWQIDVGVAGAPEGEDARGLVESLRAEAAPHPLLIGGAAAEFIDQQDAIGSKLLLAGGLLAALTFAVLWLMTGSVILPVKAILMNVLTVGSALGILTFIYQDGRLEGLLGYTANGGIESTDFLITTAVVFALSTDYGVFLLGRIREARTTAGSEQEAVAVGLQQTGAVVTAAAILLAVAIGAFATSSISFIQQIGVATAAGVLIDAFIVRTLLVPSLMALLGRWNWWSPMPLRRLHDRLGLSEAGEPDGPAPAGG